MNLVTHITGLTWSEQLAYLAVRLQPVEAVAPMECPVTHIFEPGVYIREIFMPAGTIAVGRPHRVGHRIEGISGMVEFFTPNGAEVREAPFEMVTKPGAQTAMVTLTDHVARTYHANPTESRDIEALELAAFISSEEVLQIGRAVSNRLEELECLV